MSKALEKRIALAEKLLRSREMVKVSNRQFRSSRLVDSLPINSGIRLDHVVLSQEEYEKLPPHMQEGATKVSGLCYRLTIKVERQSEVARIQEAQKYWLGGVPKKLNLW